MRRLGEMIELATVAAVLAVTTCSCSEDDQRGADGSGGTSGNRHDADTTPDDADSPDQTASDARELEPVRIIRGAPQSAYWDLTIRARDFASHEGAVLTVRIGDPGQSKRLGSGQARIVNGSAELLLPAVWEASSYKQKRAFIDVNGDGACTASDRVFADARAIANTDEPNVFTLQNGALTRFDIPEVKPASLETVCAAFNSPWPTE